MPESNDARLPRADDIQRAARQARAAATRRWLEILCAALSSLLGAPEGRRRGEWGRQ